MLQAARLYGAVYEAALCARTASNKASTVGALCVLHISLAVGRVPHKGVRAGARQYLSRSDWASLCSELALSRSSRLLLFVYALPKTANQGAWRTKTESTILPEAEDRPVASKHSRRVKSLSASGHSVRWDEHSLHNDVGIAAGAGAGIVGKTGIPSFAAVLVASNACPIYQTCCSDHIGNHVSSSVEDSMDCVRDDCGLYTWRALGF